MKHNKTNISYLDEDTYKKTLWKHQPLTDFWRIGRGIAKRLNNIGIYDMEGIAKADDAVLKKIFGVDYVIIGHSDRRNKFKDYS